MPQMAPQSWTCLFLATLALITLIYALLYFIVND